MMSVKRVLPVLMFGAFVLIAGKASAQNSQSSWNAEASVGWDANVTGAFLAAGIGTLDQTAAVINAQSFGDVYGTGVLWQFSGGYMVDEINEVRGQLSYQRAGSDIVNLGTANGTDLVATFDDYKSWTVEAGYRHFFATRDVRLRPYGGGTIGVAIIDEIDAVFAAPQAGITRSATDFYDGTAAFSFGVNGGALYALNNRYRHPRADRIALQQRPVTDRLVARNRPGRHQRQELSLDAADQHRHTRQLLTGSDSDAVGYPPAGVRPTNHVMPLIGLITPSLAVRPYNPAT